MEFFRVTVQIKNWVQSIPNPYSRYASHQGLFLLHAVVFSCYCVCGFTFLIKARGMEEFNCSCQQPQRHKIWSQIKVNIWNILRNAAVKMEHIAEFSPSLLCRTNFRDSNLQLQCPIKQHSLIKFTESYSILNKKWNYWSAGNNQNRSSDLRFN